MAGGVIVVGHVAHGAEEVNLQIVDVVQITAFAEADKDVLDEILDEVGVVDEFKTVVVKQIIMFFTSNPQLRAYMIQKRK